jgi:protein-serine/threonine kinase
VRSRCCGYVHPGFVSPARLTPFQTLKHPNIVRLYEVIETDKYIGIIIEYASGGELFDHILAHRYLKERDAAKLFSQLISGVWYIHQKKIVHRDLKLENLLLDRHRNVIITDFGFANRFEHRSDDLMQTSCGSPCYAAPELVISEGLYVGSAVDIWSCGVILYAMLAGYLPFDDDPANPDGDNINLLYKYIVNTPLSFPEYISTEARDLLSMMLVPDPTRRADLSSVMAHKWLAPYAHIFQRGVDELEQAALEQHQMKRLAYQRQMKQAAAQAKVSRTQSTKSVDVFGGKSRAGQQGIAQPDFLYETSVEQSNYVPPAAARKHHPVDVPLDDDPFSPSLSQAVSPLDDVTAEGDVRGGPRAKRSKDDGGSRTRKVSAPTSEPKKKGGFRHTIQVEYDDAQQETQQPSGLSPPRRASSKRREQEDVQMANADGRGVRERAGSQTSPSTSSPVRERGKTARRPSQSSAKPLPEPPASPFVAARDAAATSPGAGAELGSAEPGQDSAISTDSQSSKHSKHRKGLSMDRIGLGKIFGTTPATDQLNGAGSSDKSEGPSPFVGEHDKEKRPATLPLSRPQEVRDLVGYVQNVMLTVSPLSPAHRKYVISSNMHRMACSLYRPSLSPTESK